MQRYPHDCLYLIDCMHSYGRIGVFLSLLWRMIFIVNSYRVFEHRWLNYHPKEPSFFHLHMVKGKSVTSFDLGNKNSTRYPCSLSDPRPTIREPIDYSCFVREKCIITKSIFIFIDLNKLSQNFSLIKFPL